MKKGFIWLVILAICVCMIASFSLIGCKEEAPSEGIDEEVEEAVEEEAVEEEAVEEAVPEKVTINVWIGQDSAKANFWDPFMELHPNIEIKYEEHAINELRDILGSALTGGTGPDLFAYDAGPANAGVLERGGLLMDLGEAYEKYGWNDRIFEWTKSRVTYGGKLSGIADSVGFLGVFYNKDIFEEIGADVPESHAELLEIAEKATDAGYIGFSMPDMDAWPATNVFSMFVNNVLGPENMDNLIWENGNWNQPDVISAAKRLFDDTRPYWQEGAVSMTYDEAIELFKAGEVAMFPTGSWMVGDWGFGQVDFTGFFFYPSIEGGPVYPPGGVEEALFVSANAKYPDETLELLAFMMAPENYGEWLTAVGYTLPFDMTEAAKELEISPLVQFAVEVVSEISSGAGFGYNIDVVTPERFNDAMYTGFQAVMIEEMSVEEVIEEMQMRWEEAIEEGTVLER